jgi:hypothetical protein
MMEAGGGGSTLGVGSVGSGRMGAFHAETAIALAAIESAETGLPARVEAVGR